MICSRPINRVRTTLAAAAAVVAVAIAAVPALGSSASAAATTKPAAGTIHIYDINTSLNPTTPNSVLITGAFSDHGTDQHGTFHLAKGTISVNRSAVKAITTSRFGTFNPKSCSFQGVATGPVPIVSGTGAYAGIHGTLKTTETDAEQGSLLKSGKCVQSNNVGAPGVAQDVIFTAIANVSF